MQIRLGEEKEKSKKTNRRRDRGLDKEERERDIAIYGWGRRKRRKKERGREWREKGRGAETSRKNSTSEHRDSGLVRLSVERAFTSPRHAWLGKPHSVAATTCHNNFSFSSLITPIEKKTNTSRIFSSVSKTCWIFEMFIHFNLLLKK